MSTKLATHEINFHESKNYIGTLHRILIAEVVVISLVDLCVRSYKHSIQFVIKSYKQIANYICVCNNQLYIQQSAYIIIFIST